jgi:hypothetical protein
MSGRSKKGGGSTRNTVRFAAEMIGVPPMEKTNMAGTAMPRSEQH